MSGPFFENLKTTPTSNSKYPRTLILTDPLLKKAWIFFAHAFCPRESFTSFLVPERAKKTESRNRMLDDVLNANLHNNYYACRIEQLLSWLQPCVRFPSRIVAYANTFWKGPKLVASCCACFAVVSIARNWMMWRDSHTFSGGNGENTL